MKRAALPTCFALLAIVCVALGHSPVEADRSHGTKLGQDWRKLSNSLDSAYEAMHKDAGVVATPIVDDDTFLRRVYLDLTGAPPSPDQIKAFNPGRHEIGDRRNAQQREALIEQLLAAPEFTQHMSQWWTVVLNERQPGRIGPRRVSELTGYLMRAFAANTPWDMVVRDLMGTGKGSGLPLLPMMLADQGEFAYVSGNVPRVLLGRQIQCAECHDHPYDPWTMDDFEAWTAFFKSFITSYEAGDEVYLRVGMDMQFSSARDLEAQLDLKGRYKLPRYLDGTNWKPGSGLTLREDMTNWMISKDNPWLSEMTVNRFITYFMGVGFVNPVDDFNSLNDPTIPIVLRVMGEDFAASGYDIRYLIRAIVNSRMYQRETGANLTNIDDRMLFSRQFVRELSPESVQRSILKILQVETLNPPAKATRRIGAAQAAEAAKDLNVAIYVQRLTQMINNAWQGEPPHKDVDDRGGNIDRALMFMNGDLMPRGLKTSLSEILKTHRKPRDRAEAIFTTVLGRRPKVHELDLLEATIKDWSGKRRSDDEVFEDLFLSLMATPEFVNRT